MKEYNTSNTNFTIKIAQTQSQKLAFFQQEVIASYIAPKRNKHIFGVMSYDSDNTFYFGPDYNYGDDDIIETQQVVIIHDGEIEDTYSIFDIIQEDGENVLSISYNN